VLRGLSSNTNTYSPTPTPAICWTCVCVGVCVCVCVCVCVSCAKPPPRAKVMQLADSFHSHVAINCVCPFLCRGGRNTDQAGRRGYWVVGLCVCVCVWVCVCVCVVVWGGAGGERAVT